MNVRIIMETSTHCIPISTLEYYMSRSCIPPCELEGIADASTRNPTLLQLLPRLFGYLPLRPIHSTRNIIHYILLVLSCVSKEVAVQTSIIQGKTITHWYDAISIPFPITSWPHTWPSPMVFIAIVGVISSYLT
jgi:hypothetical protein